MNARERRIRQRLKDDFVHYASRCLQIRSKSGEVSKLVLNTAQQHIHTRIEQQLKESGRVRAIILKGRQQGCSTYVEGRFYWRVTHSRGRRAFILTHEDAATQNLFEMTTRYHEHCPELVKPSTGASNAKELAFDRLDSGYKIGTAGTKGVGRSSTVQFFHGSEVAFWPNAETHMAGVLQAVPSKENTEIILESTANGVGGVFHELWQDAAGGEGDYLPIFVPWYWQDEYVRDADGFSPAAEEQVLAKRHGLSDEQLSWRRAKIHELKSEDLFRQEYPCTPEEAFLFSGRPVFDPNWIMEAVDECYSPTRRADIRGGLPSNCKSGNLRVWQEPEDGMRYVIGADVAEGLVHGDYSCADVVDARGNQVAQWHGHVEPDRFGEIIGALGKYYFGAFVGVERNNHGLTTLTALKNSGYPNLYAEEHLDRRADGKQTKRIGWLTTTKSKPLIIDRLAGLLRDGESGIVCRETVEECRSYVVEESGSTNAEHGCFDDRVMSYAIAQEMLVRMPRRDMKRIVRPKYQPISSVGGY